MQCLKVENEMKIYNECIVLMNSQAACPRADFVSYRGAPSQQSGLVILSVSLSRQSSTVR